jgi:hypothetical protein
MSPPTNPAQRNQAGFNTRTCKQTPDLNITTINFSFPFSWNPKKRANQQPTNMGRSGKGVGACVSQSVHSALLVWIAD